MAMRLDQLRSFEAVARLASFTRAAEELFVAQPSLSRQIAALEAERIGVDAVMADRAPTTLVEFNAYDAVVLCNVPAYAFSEAQQVALRQYVEDGGGGLLSAVTSYLAPGVYNVYVGSYMHGMGGPYTLSVTAH